MLLFHYVHVIYELDVSDRQLLRTFKNCMKKTETKLVIKRKTYIKKMQGNIKSQQLKLTATPNAPILSSSFK